MNAGKPARLAAAVLAIVAGTAAGVARADEGMVIWKNNECGFFILQMKAGYGLYEWVAGPYPNESDVIEGDLKAPGEHRVNNKTADVPTTIFLDTFSEKRPAISSRIPAKCKAKPGYVPFEGQ
ncbi:MAG: hypothetical protein HY067_09090 [Betaproteobacteria bacterium]|nr:hypothetical protein [Betaproteobacteria bacterium]